MTSSPAYSPCDPAFGCSDIPANPVISPSHFSRSANNCWYPRVCFRGTKGCNPVNCGHDTGIISAAAFSFIVHDPSGIIECASDRSRDSRRFKYRINSVSERCVRNTSWIKNSLSRRSWAGSASLAAKSSSSKGTSRPSLNTCSSSATSASVVVSSSATPTPRSSSARRLMR